MKLQTTPFGTTDDGRHASLYTLTNASGASAEITDYGCTVRALNVFDRGGRLRDVCMGYDDVSGYERGGGYAGAIVGRYANRIAGAAFTLNGREYRLYKNNGENALHGGKRGFDKYIWDAEAREDGLLFTRVSPDGEEGFPGALSTRVLYTWSDDCALTIRIEAETDADTIVNLTNHAYFNLSGGSCSAMAHELWLNADAYCPADEHLVATGELRPVDGTPFDFRTAKPLGRDVDADDTQLRYGGGYDHNFALGAPGTMRRAAVLYAPDSGIRMTVSTDLPGVQLYTANSLSACRCAYGTTYERRGAVCLETQYFPNSPACPQFPSVVLKKGARWTHTTIYQFGTEKESNE